MNTHTHTNYLKNGVVNVFNKKASKSSNNDFKILSFAFMFFIFIALYHFSSKKKKTCCFKIVECNAAHFLLEWHCEFHTVSFNFINLLQLGLLYSKHYHNFTTFIKHFIIWYSFHCIHDLEFNLIFFFIIKIESSVLYFFSFLVLKTDFIYVHVSIGSVFVFVFFLLLHF